MLTSRPSTSRRLVRPLALTLFAGLVLLLSALAGSAGATEFQPKPVLAIDSGCVGKVFHYEVLMYNQGNDWTNFTVAAVINGNHTTANHAVAPFSVETEDFVIPEGEYGEFHVTNLDPPGIDDTRNRTADCIDGPEDCPPESTTSTTWTTTSTTSTTTSTTSTTVPKPTSTTSTTSTTAAPATSTTVAPTTSVTPTTSPVLVEGASVVRTATTVTPAAVRSADALAVTGSTSRPLGLMGLGLVLLGASAWLLAQRRRAA